jgi:hypothetical protein
MFGPSEFPVELQLITQGHLGSIACSSSRSRVRTARRRCGAAIFKNKRGDAITGIMGLLTLALFGKVPAGFSDLGLGNDPNGEVDQAQSTTKEG